MKLHIVIFIYELKSRSKFRANGIDPGSFKCDNDVDLQLKIFIRKLERESKIIARKKRFYSRKKVKNDFNENKNRIFIFSHNLHEQHLMISIKNLRKYSFCIQLIKNDYDQIS